MGSILGAKARDAGCALVAFGAGWDHVHLLVHLAPTLGIVEVVRRLKGGSAFDINLHGLLPERLAWQDGYWAESIAPADIPHVARYLRSQRAHHDAHHPAEPWLEDEDAV